MKHMSLKEIAAACGGTYFGSSDAAIREVGSVVIDSRKVERDSLFIAIKGARVDGHTFIPQVMKNGALCALSERKLDNADFPYILVNSCLQALKDLAEYYRRVLQLKVVGISGSVGKTSTKEMIASILSQKFNVLKTEGNFNNEIGLPLTVFRLREEHEIAVLEMGISDFGEMSRLAKIARPDICVITNIGCAHLENLKSRDGILKAKTEMFDYMNPQGTIILNGDDDKLKNFSPSNGISPIYFGLDALLPYHAKDIKDNGLDGTSARFFTPHSDFTAHVSIPGKHMIYNALAGIAVGRVLGMNDAEIIQGIEHLVPLAGRNNLIQTEYLTIIDDCYNANPASMKSSLSVLSRADTRTVAVLGDMFELGPQINELHAEVGRYASKTGIKVLICIGDYSAHMAKGAQGERTSLCSEMEIHYFKTKTEFLENADKLLKKNDTVLVKASHGMEFPEIVERLKEMR